MELVKKNIHMNRMQCKSILQLTLDDDFNVPDSKPDIAAVISQQARILLDDRKLVNGKYMIRGSLSFHILYLSEESARPVNSLSGEIPFDEVINVDEGCHAENMALTWDIEDLTTGIINSRKISVRSIVRFQAVASELHDEEAVVAATGIAEAECLYRPIRVTGLAVDKKDSYRLKEEIMLPSGKGNISEILYSEVELKNAEVRLLTDKFTVKGEVSVFFLYRSENEENPVEYYETELPFSASVDCNGCEEEMVENIEISLAGRNLESKPDADGEMRMVDAEMIFDMNIKIYREEEFEILSDIYSPILEVTPERSVSDYENLIMKNQTKARITDRVKVSGGNPKILQLCHGTGSVKVDETEITPAGIQVEGVIEAELLYISAEDEHPLQAVKSMIPFSQLIEVRGITPECVYEVNAGVDQIAVMMLDAEEIEVKVGLHLNSIVFEPVKEPMITGVTTAPFPAERAERRPAFVGYVVKEGDTLWSIAKEYDTTRDTIREQNALESDMLQVGDRLLIIKKVQSVF